MPIYLATNRKKELIVEEQTGTIPQNHVEAFRRIQHAESEIVRWRSAFIECYSNFVGLFVASTIDTIDKSEVQELMDKHIKAGSADKLLLAGGAGPAYLHLSEEIYGPEYIKDDENSSVVTFRDSARLRETIQLAIASSEAVVNTSKRIMAAIDKGDWEVQDAEMFNLKTTIEELEEVVGKAKDAIR
jgi:hypothetical protein